MTKNAVLNLAPCCGAIWRHREKPQYKCTTRVLQVHKGLKDIYENLLPIWLLGRTNLFVPSHFWTTCMNFDNGCQRCIASCWKKLYRCASTFLALNYYGGIFFKSLSCLYEVGAQTFTPITLFTIFDRNYAKIVATPSDENKKCPAILKGQFRVATSLGEKNSRTFQGHSSTFSRPISATFYCDAGILKVIA